MMRSSPKFMTALFCVTLSSGFLPALAQAPAPAASPSAAGGARSFVGANAAASPLSFVPRYGFKEGQPFSGKQVSSGGDPSDLRRRVKQTNNLVWSEDKIGRVHDLILKLRKQAPGLLKLANARAPIKIYLFDKLEVVTADDIAGAPSQVSKTPAEAESPVVKSTLPNLTDSECLAFGKADCLLLSKKFFESKSELQYHALVHEVVHMADEDGLISISPAWIKLAGPYLNPTSKEYSPTFGSEHWPKYYGNALSESLAAYVADDLNGKVYPSKKQFDESVAPLLFSPGQSELDWCQLVFAAREKMQSAAFDDATIKLDRATQLLPEQPTTYYYLAMAAAKTFNLNNTLTDIQDFTEKFAELNISGLDPLEVSCLKNVVNVYVDSKHYEDAVSLLEPLCIKFPREPWFAARRYFCNAQIK